MNEVVVSRSDAVPESDRSGIQVIARAAAILRTLEGVQDGLSLAEIARSVDLPRTTVHRIVSSLADEGLVVAASPNAKVRLGPAVLQLAASLDYDIKKILHPFLVDLHRDVNDTVDLAILRGGSAVFIDQVQGRRRLVAMTTLGERFPLHCSANGKALLSELPSDDLARALDRSVREHPDHPLPDRAALLAELGMVRKTHLAFDREENNPGVGAVGFALRDATGTLFAISVPMPIQRFRRVEKALVETAIAHRDKISAKVSGRY